jgi:hypothetical protein
MSRASKDRRAMSTAERALRGPEIEVVAKATRRRFTLGPLLTRQYTDRTA